MHSSSLVHDSRAFARSLRILAAFSALVACGGGGGGTDALPDAGTAPTDAGATPREDAGTTPAEDAGGTDPMGDAGAPVDDDAGTPVDEDAGAPCPAGYTGEGCAECAAGYTDFGGVCVIGCEAMGDDALDCGLGGACMIDPADGTRFCACSDGYEGDSCETCSAGWSASGRRCTLDPPPALGLTLWLDADEADSLALDDAMRVTEWSDRRGLDVVATPTAVITRPTYQPTGRNERGTLAFDGVDDQLAVSNFTGLGATDVEVIVAGDFRGELPTGIFAALTGTSDWALLIERVSGTDLRATYRSTPGTSGGVEVLVDRAAALRPMYVSVTHQTSTPSDSLAVFASDGATEAAGLHLFPAPSARLPSPIGLRIGRTQNGRLQGEIYEVLVYSRRLSVAERAQVALYLRQKWDLR